MSESSTGRRPALLGDEEELFRGFNRALVRIVQHQTNTPREVVDDACAFAWQQSIDELDSGAPAEWDVPDRDRAAIRMRLRDALEAFSRLLERRREIKALQVTGFSYEEIAEMRGLTYTRVNHILAEANATLRAQQARSAAARIDGPPRAQRLHELERDPPRWLRVLIGPVPSAVTDARAVLAWRRAALTLDDYRRTPGPRCSVRSGPSAGRRADVGSGEGELRDRCASNGVDINDDTHPIVLNDRLVALAAPARCYLLADNLTEDEIRYVTAMCLCSREVRIGRLAGPFTNELAEEWARVYLSLET